VVELTIVFQQAHSENPPLDARLSELSLLQAEFLPIFVSKFVAMATGVTHG